MVVVVSSLNKSHLDMVSRNSMLGLQTSVHIGQFCSWTAREGEGHPVGSPKQGSVQGQEEGGVHRAAEVLEGSSCGAFRVYQGNMMAEA